MNLVAFYFDVSRIEHTIGCCNLEALCTGQAVCVVESHNDAVVHSSNNITRRWTFALQLMTISVLECLQSQSLAYGTLRAVVNIGWVAKVAAYSYPRIWQLGGQATLTVAERRP